MKMKVTILMKYYKVKNDIRLISNKMVTCGMVKAHEQVYLIENELITENELKRLRIDQYKDNSNVFEVIITSSHNTYWFFGTRFLIHD